MPDFVEIDGSYLEGGGQIVRIALSLSCILRKPVRIINIRANRSEPGLSYQHLHTVNLLRDMTNGHVTGNELRSKMIEFEPGEIMADDFLVDTRTAASISLVYQAALPVMLFAPRRTHLTAYGGTNVKMAPPFEYMTDVLALNVAKFGVDVNFELLRRGYYPRGGGHTILSVTPVKELQAVNLSDFGDLIEVQGYAYFGGRMPRKVANDMQRSGEREIHRLWPSINCKIDIFKESSDITRDNASGFVLRGCSSTGAIVGATAYGERHCDGHTLGTTLTRKICSFLKEEICVDNYLQDQLIIFMALAKGESSILTCPLTKHTRTAMYTVQLLTGVQFDTTYNQRDQIILTCTGIGHKNPHLQ